MTWWKLRNLFYKYTPPDDYMKELYEWCTLELVSYGIYGTRQKYQMLDDYCPDWDYLSPNDKNDFYMYLRSLL